MRLVAAKSWAALVFGRLNRQQCALDFARELAELAEKDAAELRKAVSALVYELKSERERDERPLASRSCLVADALLDLGFPIRVAKSIVPELERWRVR